MSDLIGLLDQLRQRQVTVWLENDRLRYRAPKNTLEPELLAELKARKAEILTFLKQANAQDQIPSIEAIDRQQPLPLSFAQQRLWFLQQLEPNSTANNMPVVVKFEGQLDIDQLEQSIQKVVQRHEVLRTCFPIVNGQPTVCLQEQIAIKLPVIDLRHLPSSQKREREAHRLATEAAHHPFDLTQGPMLSIRLFKLEDQVFLLLWNMHCIVCDGASSDIFYQDLIAIYRALSAGQAPTLPNLTVQYADFSHWQRAWLQGSVLETQLDYWRQIINGDLSSIRLPIDHPRPQNVQSYRGDRAARMLPLELNQALTNLSQCSGATLFMVLLAAFQVLLHRYSSQEDLLINVASAGRGTLETEGLLGFFSNTLLLRADLSGNPSFSELLQRVKQSSLQAFAHQDLPFEKVVVELHPEQRNIHSSLFQVKFALNPPWSKGRGMAAVQLPDLNIHSLFGYIHHGQTKYDLMLVMREQDEGLGMVFDYNAELFNAETMARMVDHFHTLLQGIITNPGQRISELPLLTPQEQQTLVPQDHWKAAPTIGLHRRFEAQVEQSPDAIALITHNQQFTYRALNSQANQLAHYLQQQGITAKTTVVVEINQPILRVIAQLAILKAGGIYIPIDVDSPIHFLNQTLTDLPPVLLTQNARESEDRFSNIINIDAIQSAVQGQSTTNLKSSDYTPDVACILFVQKPDRQKWISIHLTHSGIHHAATGATVLHLSSADRWLQIAPVTHERSLWETFSALLHGGQLVLPQHPVTTTELSQSIQQLKVTTVYLPTRLFNSLIEHDLQALASIKTCLIGGDIASPHHIHQFQQTLPDSNLFNTYGRIENSGLVCLHPMHEPPSAQATAQVGHPLDQTQVYILDQHRQPLPMGVEGELYIGGTGLAQGDTSGSSSSWVHHSFGPSSSDYLFRTGERAKYLPDCSILLLGHTPPIPLNGLSIRLSEIEMVLNQHPLVKESKLINITSEKALPSIVAYVVAQQDPVTSNLLSDFLKGQLPVHGLSISFVVLESFPLTVAGEIALQQLPEPIIGQDKVEEIKVAAASPLEQQLLQLWQEILTVETIGTTDNFFALGGNSLLAITLALQIQEKLGKALPLASFFQAPTIKEQVQVLQQDHATLDYYSLLPIQATGTYPPLFFIHFINRTLTDCFGAEQPIYGIRFGMAAQVSDTPDETIPQQVEALAAHYIQEMRRLQPNGPYYLIGNSFGGTVTFEMAKQLSEQGEKVAFLAVFDTSLWDRPNRFSVMQRLSRRVVKTWRSGFSGFKGCVKYRLGKLHYTWKYKGKYTPHIDWENEVLLFENYLPTSYAGKVTLFNSTETAAQYDDPKWLSQQWSQVTEELVTIDMPGDHTGMLEAPHVEGLATVLKRCLEEARTEAEQGLQPPPIRSPEKMSVAP